MNSLNSDRCIDAIIRDALRSVAEAHPPNGVWQRIVIELDQTAAHQRNRFSWLKIFEGFSISHLTQRYCVGPYGRCLPLPFTQIMTIQFRGQHIAT